MLTHDEISKDLYGPKPQLKCETKAMKTGEHCPEKPTRVVYDEDEYFFLCERCYKTHMSKKERQGHITTV